MEPVWKKHWPASVDEKAIRLPEVLPVILARQAKRVPDRAAIQFYGRAVSFRELDSAWAASGFLVSAASPPETASPSSSRTRPSSPSPITARFARRDRRLPEPDAQGSGAPARVRGLRSARPRHLRPRLCGAGAHPRADEAGNGGADGLPRLPAREPYLAAAALVPGSAQRRAAGRHARAARHPAHRSGIEDAGAARALRYGSLAIHLGNHRHRQGRRDHPRQPRLLLRAAARLHRLGRQRRCAWRLALVPHHRHGMPDEHDGVHGRHAGGYRPLRPGHRPARGGGLPLHAHHLHRHRQRRGGQLSQDEGIRSLVFAPLLLRRRAGAGRHRATLGRDHRTQAD